MSDNTIIQQGFFTSTGAAQTISLRSGIDWMRVYNTTQAAAAQTTAIGVEYYWQAGFPQGAMWEYLKSNSASAANLSQYLLVGGFTYIDSSVFNYGAINATLTAISTAAVPVATNSGSNGLIAGQVVRLFNVAGAGELNGVDYTVGQQTLSSSTFSLDYASQLAVAGTTGSWMLVNSNPLYYPSHRVITIGANNNDGTMDLQFSVIHNYQVGQTLRLNIPAVYGSWSVLNGVLGTVVAINVNASNNSVTLNIDAGSLSVFATPAASAVPYTQASVTPVGENTAIAESLNVNILSDATYNSGFIGMQLGAGANAPAGSNDDVVYWVAGKSFSNNGR